MAGDNYRLRLVQNDREFEVEGSEKFIEKMLARHWESAPHVVPRDAKSSGRSRSESKKPTKPSSVAEFIRAFGARKHTDLVLLFGYYLEKQTGQEDFTAADINNCYYEAKLEGSNTSQMLIHNIRSGRVMQAKGAGGRRRRYRLTSTGEKAVSQMQRDAAAAE